MYIQYGSGTGATCTIGLGTEPESVSAVHIQRNNSVGHVSGRLNVGLAVNLGNDPETTGTGTYIISGGMLATANLNVGVHREGWFEQKSILGSNPTVAVIGTLWVGAYGSCSRFPNTDVSVYTLSGGRLEAGEVYLGHKTMGVFIQTGGVHEVEGSLAVGRESGKGVYQMSGGTLTVGGGVSVGGPYGSDGTFTQDRDSEVQAGRLSVSGRYSILSGQSALVATQQQGIDVTGRFEWFGGSFSPRNIQTPLMTLQPGCSLAMGFDFDVEDLLDFEDGPLAGLSGAFLEISNGATATQGERGLSVPWLRIGDWTFRGEAAEDYSGTYLLEGGTVSVGTCEVGGLYGTPGTLGVSGGQMTVSGNLNIGTHSYAWMEGQDPHSVIGQGTVTLSGGTLTVAGTCSVGGPESKTVLGSDGTLVILGGDLSVGGSLSFVPKVHAHDQESGSGVLAVGSEEQPVDATITLGAHVVFGPRSDFTTLAPEGQASYCTLLFTGEACGLDIQVQDKVGATPLPGLGAATLVFPMEDPCSGSLEAAGEDNGLPEAGAFTAKNFTLGRVVVGNEDEGDPESEYGPVYLSLGNSEDNQADFVGSEAVYVDVLTMAPGGTFWEWDWGSEQHVLTTSLYYLRNDPEDDPCPRRLYMGDADLDGDVDFSDYQALEANFGTTCGATWDMGDFDGDRDVDFADYQILEANFGKGVRGDGGGEEGDSSFDARPLAKLMDYDDDGDVDLDDLHILQEMMKEEEQDGG